MPALAPELAVPFLITEERKEREEVEEEVWVDCEASDAELREKLKVEVVGGWPATGPKVGFI